MTPSLAAATPAAPASAPHAAPPPPPIAVGATDAGGFTLASTQPVPNLNLVLQTWNHPTGAVHYHLSAADPHCGFCVSFHTIPNDSTGLPHILEHLVLCGSARFPVRDPFFLMLRRSLQTFMNAMTGPDGTYYPFSSQVKKDFDNLLGIYLDAVFAPNLNPLDFAQEGYRLEPSDGPAARPTSPEGWAFKGVVYNEMKGAMGNADAQLYRHAGQVLVPSTPYRHNSGGEPADIPALAYDDLVRFHAAHYNAANACFATYGDLDVAELHAKFAPYLAMRPGTPIALPAAEAPHGAPSSATFPVPLQDGQDARDVTIATVNWVTGDLRDLTDSLELELIDQLLLGHAGAPLRLAVESSGIGRAMASSGASGYGANGTFGVGIKGLDPADGPRFETLVLDTIERLVADGVPKDDIEAALHQLELERRLISGDRFPFCLELALSATDAWQLGLDPYLYLDQDSAIEALRARALAPGWLSRALGARFLDNPHRALMVTVPDAEWNRRQDTEERSRINARVATLDDAAQGAIIAQDAALEQRQAEVDDVSVLPELLLSDIPRELRWYEGRTVADGLDVFNAGTNGILHQVAAMPLGPLSARDLELLPLLIGAVGKLGVGKRDYTKQAALINAVCGGLSAWVDLRTSAADPAVVNGYAFFETLGLARKYPDFAGLIAETLTAQRFDETDRLLEIIEQAVVGMMQRISYGGNTLAEQAAMRGFGGRAGLDYRFSGLGRLRWLEDIAERGGKDKGTIRAIGAELSLLMARLAARPVHVALIGDVADDSGVQDRTMDVWSSFDRPAAFAPDATRTPLPGPEPSAPRAYTTATQVNYCALALPAPAITHPDAAVLSVAARYLANAYLHQRIREKGGAYGSRAAYSASLAAFTTTTYRDPRLADTFTDMREGLRWLATIDDEERHLREAVLRSIADLDRPQSPSGEGRRRFVGDLIGYGPDVIGTYRTRMLATTTEDIRRVAAAWLDPDRASAAVVTSRDMLSASGLGWESEAIGQRGAALMAELGEDGEDDGDDGDEA
ncbi:MAG: insulinase family protein [Ardenticatenales bacterium]